jgi:hypothetical protein
MWLMRSEVSNTTVTKPFFVLSSTFHSCALRSSQMSHACFRNASSSITRSFSAHVSSARPSVA